MRILLTGASGFVGRYVLSALNRAGHEVIAISGRQQSYPNSKLVKWITVDLLNEYDDRKIFSKEQVDILIHLAWYAEHGKFWTSTANFDWCAATLRLLDAFVEQGGKRAVFAGTCAEYSWLYGCCTEGITPTEPTTIYGICKDSTRRLTQAFTENKGVEWVWGRIFFPFGMGEAENRLLPSVINALLNDDPVQCTHGQQYRDFIPIEEVASAFVHLACNTDEVGEFNISTAIPTRVADVIEFCIKHINSNNVPEFGAIKVSQNDPLMLVGDNRKLLQSGWKSQLSWQVALTRLIYSYKQISESNRRK